MIEVVKVKPLDNWKLHLVFSNGHNADIDIKPFITVGISEALKDEAFFNRVKIDEFGGIAWENGYDFCPNYLWELAQDVEAKGKA